MFWKLLSNGKICLSLGTFATEMTRAFFISLKNYDLCVFQGFLQQLRQIAARMSSGPRGSGLGLKLLFGAGALAYGVKEATYTGTAVSPASSSHVCQPNRHLSEDRNDICFYGSHSELEPWEVKQYGFSSGQEQL